MKPLLKTSQRWWCFYANFFHFCVLAYSTDLAGVFLELRVVDVVFWLKPMIFDLLHLRQINDFILLILFIFQVFFEIQSKRLQFQRCIFNHIFMLNALDFHFYVRRIVHNYILYFLLVILLLDQILDVSAILTLFCIILLVLAHHFVPVIKD